MMIFSSYFDRDFISHNVFNNSIGIACEKRAKKFHRINDRLI